MKKRLWIIAFILFWLASMVVGYRLYSNQKQKRKIAESNVFALRADTTNKANQLIINRKEFNKLFSEKDSIIKAQGFKLKDVHQVHFIKYIYVHDTIATTKIVKEYVGNDGQLYGDLQWSFNHGCFQSVVTYNTELDIASDTLMGEIELTRYIIRERPPLLRRVFIPRNWWRENWPRSTRLENSCGFEIKENTIFELK